MLIILSTKTFQRNAPGNAICRLDYRDIAFRAGFFTIVFVQKWGVKSWLVDFNGKYDQVRPPHVELRQNESEENTMYDKIVPYSIFRVVNLHKKGKAIMWDVDMADFNETPEEIPHLTVHYGPRLISEFQII